MDANKIILVGRVTGEPEITTIQSGAEVAKFSLATNKRWKDKQGNKKEKVTYHNIVAWGGVVKVISNYVKRGQQLFIVGEVDNRTYEDKQGNKRYISEVILSELSLGQQVQKSDFQKSAEENNQNKVKSEEIEQELPVIDEEEIEQELPVIDEEEIDIKDIPF